MGNWGEISLYTYRSYFTPFITIVGAHLVQTSIISAQNLPKNNRKKTQIAGCCLHYTFQLSFKELDIFLVQFRPGNEVAAGSKTWSKLGEEFSTSNGACFGYAWITVTCLIAPKPKGKTFCSYVVFTVDSTQIYIPVKAFKKNNTEILYHL